MLSVLAVPLPVFIEYATESRPLRPSRVARLLSCPMSAFLSDDHTAGNAAAQTGNLVHDAIEVWHKTGDRAAAIQAIANAREQFPEGDPGQATTWFGSYAADPENQTPVIWCEAPVRLVLPPDASDPTGQPVVIQGTLDQVRRHPDGTLRVWDVKSGSQKAEDLLLEHAIQQAVYVLAARATLDPGILPGGLIILRNYGVARAKVHAPLPFGVDECTILLSAVPLAVAAIRRGLPVFRPSPDGCRFCEARPWPSCVETYKRLL